MPSWLANLRLAFLRPNADIGRSAISEFALDAAQEASTERALRLAAVTKLDVSTIAFFEQRAHDFISYKDLLRTGTLLTAAQKRNLGIATKAHVGSEFIETLNETGMADVQRAAGRVAFTLNRQRQTLKSLRQTLDAGIRRVEFLPSQAAAGPCDAAQKQTRLLVPVRQAPLLPFAICQHPDQCACTWLAAWSELD